MHAPLTKETKTKNNIVSLSYSSLAKAEADFVRFVMFDRLVILVCIKYYVEYSLTYATQSITSNSVQNIEQRCPTSVVSVSRVAKELLTTRVVL